MKKAAVIGAGSMGSGIAAQFANAGVPVVLLDIAAPPPAGRSSIAEGGVTRQLGAGGFMHPDQAKRVQAGNLEDDLALLADADWIVEVVVEDLAVKRDLFRRIEAARKDGSVVSSNTSTIPLARLTEGMGARFAGDFVVSHFFNPPRLMQLVEIVQGPETSPASADKVRAAADRYLGKTVVNCRDTPAFIANRIGCYWMTVASLEAMRLGLTVEEADAVASAPFGVPRTGVFGLFDLIGIDLVPKVWGSLLGALVPEDGHRQYDIVGDPVFRRMIDQGLIGRKSKAGFYRQTGSGAARQRQVMDFATGEYRAEQPAALDSLKAAGKDLRRLCEQPDRGGRYAWRVLSQTVGYSAAVAADIADDVAAVDVAVCLGYNWAVGPFALADRVGPGWIADRLAAEGRPVPPLLKRAAELGGFYRGQMALGTDGEYRAPYRAPGSFALADAKRDRKPVAGNEAASLWDLGDGIACLEVHTKMNTLGPAVLDIAEQALHIVPAGFRGLVIGNDHARAYSSGADLQYFVDRAAAADWAALAVFVERGQTILRALRAARFPVVAAAFGLALGGGCETLLHADAIVAEAELNAGLPEVKVGLIPGWGGTTRMLLNRIARGLDPAAAAAQAFDVLMAAPTSSSALQARASGILGPDDQIVMNRAGILSAAKAAALRLANGYRPPAPVDAVLPGAAGKAALLATLPAGATGNDRVIAEILAGVLAGGAGGAVSEEAIYALEREALGTLVRRPATLDRMRHMLATGKPLAN